VLVQEKDLPEKPLHGSDPLNLFVVVETGDHHATILDGDRLEPIHRFATRRALHGGPKFSNDGRFVYFASRDGWITKFDLHSLQTVTELRAGIHTRNLAVSGDGRYLAEANYLPYSLVILDARDLEPLKLIPVHDDQGKGSRVSAVYAAPPRQSFVAALKDIPEVWEILVADDPLPVYNGPVHDYRMGEGTAREPGPYPCHRQGDPRDRRDPEARPGQDRRPRRVRPLRALCPGEHLGGRRGHRRLRRQDPQGGQAPADAQTLGQIQRLQQDHPLGGHQPLGSSTETQSALPFGFVPRHVFGAESP
jgi:hypothetical protein